MTETETEKPFEWGAALILILMVLGIGAFIVWMVYTNPNSMKFVYDVIYSIPGMSTALP